MFVHNGSLSARQKFSVKETKRYLRQNYSRFAKPQMGLGWVQGQSVFVIHTWFVAVQSVYLSMCVCVQIFTRRDKCEYISIPHTLSGSIFHQKFSAQSKTSGTAHSEKSCRTKERKKTKKACADCFIEIRCLAFYAIWIFLKDHGMVLRTWPLSWFGVW